MGVMDFLKGLFSSKQEDQSSNNVSDQGSSEPTLEEPKAEEGIDNQSEADDSGIQE
jgi:hypothetical protein